MKGQVLGPRVLVELEEPKDSLAERAKLSGLSLVMDDRNKPKPTCGRVIGMGSDPLLNELGLKVGTRVSFRPNAGDRQFIEGKEYRILEAQEVVMILQEEGKETE